MPANKSNSQSSGTHSRPMFPGGRGRQLVGGFLGWAGLSRGYRHWLCAFVPDVSPNEARLPVGDSTVTQVFPHRFSRAKIASCQLHSARYRIGFQFQPPRGHHRSAGCNSGIDQPPVSLHTSYTYLSTWLSLARPSSGKLSDFYITKCQMGG